MIRLSEERADIPSCRVGNDAGGAFGSVSRPGIGGETRRRIALMPRA